MSNKEQQLGNFCHQLRENIIKFGIKEFNLTGCNKYVWIITRGSLRKIREINHIKIIEVPITKLFEIYLERLKNDFYEKEDLEKQLRDIVP